MTIEIYPNPTPDQTLGKLADVALRFTEGPLAGLTLAGFAIWERHGPTRGQHVTFPCDKRTPAATVWTSTPYLRATRDDSHAVEDLRAAILAAYQATLDPSGVETVTACIEYLETEGDGDWLIVLDSGRVLRGTTADAELVDDYVGAAIPLQVSYLRKTDRFMGIAPMPTPPALRPRPRRLPGGHIEPKGGR